MYHQRESKKYYTYDNTDIYAVESDNPLEFALIKIETVQSSTRSTIEFDCTRGQLEYLYATIAGVLNRDANKQLQESTEKEEE